MPILKGQSTKRGLVRKLENVYTEPNTGCWIWPGYMYLTGYGGAIFGGKMIKAHRASYMHHHGLSEIPDGLYVLHKCDLKMCVNPDHLFLGTHNDNMADMAKKGRSGVRGSKSPNTKFSETDVIAIKSRIGLGEVHARIAADYNCSRSAVSAIAKGKNWGHLGVTA